MAYDPQEFRVNGAALARLASTPARGFGALHEAVLDDGVLDRATKELMALAISVATGCEDCCGHHLDQALSAGATEEQLSETLGVAVMMGGGPAYVYAGKVASMAADRR